MGAPTLSVVGDEPKPSPWTDLLPRMTDAESEDLKASVDRAGVLQPIEYAADGDLLDGYHRLMACWQLGIKDPPTRILDHIKTDEQKREYAITVNAQRRHLNQEQRRDLVDKILKADPALSDRQIAKQANVDHKTVGARRAVAEATGEIPQTNTRTGGDGRKRSTTKTHSNGSAVSEASGPQASKLVQLAAAVAAALIALEDELYARNETGEKYSALAKEAGMDEQNVKEAIDAAADRKSAQLANGKK